MTGAVPGRRRRVRAAALLLVLAVLLPPSGAWAKVLRVCADPNNMPYSNKRLEGFENRIVALLAKDLGAEVEYTWWAQRRGFIRNTLRQGACDLVPGVPSGLGTVATTRPYYRSGYVFVTRADSGLDIRSLDDPRLKELSIGVQMIGDDFSNSPPAHALSRRGIVRNVRGFLVYGDYDKEDPTARIVEAVASGEVQVAVVWGPQAGYFAKRQKVPLALAPVSPRIDGPMLPMVFDISMGVRREDMALRDGIDAALERRRAEIDAILADYGVPRLDPPKTR